jgi:hypothetical protein
LLLARQGDLAAADRELRAAELVVRNAASPVELGKLLCKRCEVDRIAGDPTAARLTLLEAEKMSLDTKAGTDSELGKMIATQRESLRVPPP